MEQIVLHHALSDIMEEHLIELANYALIIAQYVKLQMDHLFVNPA